MYENKKYYQKEFCEGSAFIPWSDGSYTDTYWVSYKDTNLCFNTGAVVKYRWYLCDTIGQSNTLNYCFRETDFRKPLGESWIELPFEELIKRLPIEDQKEILSAFEEDSDD